MPQRSIALARDRRERLLAIVADPDTLGNVCGRVMEGGTLLDVAQEWDVKYGHLHEWMHDERHPERVQAYARAMEARGGFIRDKVIRSLMQFTDMDPRKLFDKNGRLIPVHKLPDEIAAAIQGLEVSLDKKGDPVTKIKTVDKVASVSLLGRTQSMFKDTVDVKHSGTVGLADRLEGARKRVIEGSATVITEREHEGATGEAIPDGRAKRVVPERDLSAKVVDAAGLGENPLEFVPPAEDGIPCLTGVTKGKL